MDQQHLSGDEPADPVEDLFCAFETEHDSGSVMVMPPGPGVVESTTCISTRQRNFVLTVVV